ncbi:MAG: nuclear transport factor 2 family protein [Flavobacteriaceae bacterium]|jgi:tetratricopeptide (TPR) repeat protein|nr:nuclear transport factor 2 family protein [Flavobacteriaceae bacterium]MBT6705449.1 nuclear transport factor 2 family protein [Flavobacteriaceae bacterium]
MKNTLTLVALCFTVMLNAQWIDNTSCNKTSALITNQAIEYAMNLEYMAAFGAANSALLLDKNCGCAQLTLAYISSSNPKWGSRAKKLKEISATKLSAEEKAWYNYMLASSEEQKALDTSLVSQFPKSPLINYLTTSMQDFNSFKVFAEKFPLYSSSAYNMISYGYMNGSYGKEDTVAAMEYVKMSQNIHDGPNSFDSMGEHYAAMGDYENALNTQLKAIDFATFASPYRTKAQLYYAKIEQKDISEKIIADQEEMQKAIMNSDYESYKKFEHPEIKVSTGDSNLNPFYIITKEDIINDNGITWNSFKLFNMDTYFSPDMKTAVITFEADGNYTIIETNETVPYATRASATWNNTDDGWKILHTSFAPRKGKNGIPGFVK